MDTKRAIHLVNLQMANKTKYKEKPNYSSDGEYIFSKWIDRFRVIQISQWNW